MIIDYKTAMNEYCVFLHKACEPNSNARHVAFIGSCRFVDVLKPLCARNNPEWVKVSQHWLIELEVLKLFRTMVEAAAFADEMIAILRPSVNIKTTTRAAKGMTVRCLNDQNEFETINQAALFYDVPRTSISAHLRGIYGYKTVKSLRFERISEY